MLSKCYSIHCVLDDFPHRVTRITSHGRLTWRYEHAFQVLKLPSLVLTVGTRAYHQWWTSLDRSPEMSYLKSVQEAVGRAGASTARDPVMEGAMPALHEFLTAVVDDDGHARVTATLGISTDGDRWVLRLCDRHTGMVGFHAADSLQQALEGMESRLSEGTMDWRPDSFAKARKKKG